LTQTHIHTQTHIWNIAF